MAPSFTLLFLYLHCHKENHLWGFAASTGTKTTCPALQVRCLGVDLRECPFLLYLGQEPSQLVPCFKRRTTKLQDHLNNHTSCKQHLFCCTHSSTWNSAETHNQRGLIQFWKCDLFWVWLIGFFWGEKRHRNNLSKLVGGVIITHLSSMPISIPLCPKGKFINFD